MWRITAGTAASSDGDGTQLKMTEAAHNVFGSISVIDNPGELEAFHATQVEAFEGTKSQPVTFALGTTMIRDQIVYAYFNSTHAFGIEAFRLLD